MIEKLDEKDLDEVMKIYKNSIGTPGCTWSDEYPSVRTFYMDVRNENLFGMKNENGEIIGVISIDQDEVVDGLSCWSAECGKMGELARLAVREDYKGNNIAAKMIKEIMKIMKNRGYASVHYLVSKNHKRALAAYSALQFELVGESDILGGQWYCYEKRLDNEYC